MKKLLTTLLLLVLTICTIASCVPNPPPEEGGNTERQKINIGVMAGPTGMGMAKLMNDVGDESALYSFSIYSAPTDATADLANKELDMLCLPTNTAAVLANKQSDYISVISINCLGSLYLLTNDNANISSVKDLEGKTIWASVPSSTTGPIIQYLLDKNNVNATIEFEENHDLLVKKVKEGTADIVVLPEPKVTAALTQNSTYTVDLNLSEEWDKISDTPLTMGCIVVRNEFLKNNKATVDAFLADYKASIEYINNPENLDASANAIVAEGVLPALPVAKKALANLYGSIVYIEGAEMEAALKGFYAAINLKSPSDDFYYEK